MKRLTAKQSVLRKYRGRASIGKLRRYTNPITVYVVYDGPHQPGTEIGEGKTPREAWANAARRLGGKR